MFLRVLIILSIIVNVGCSNQPLSVDKNNNDYPLWVLSPPEDNADFIYGVGNAKDLAAAEKQALAAIVGKVNTQISNVTRVSLSQENGVGDERFSSVTESKVMPTEISGYQIKKTAQKQDGLWVLVALSRDDFFNSQYDKFSAMDSKLDGLMNDFNQDSALKRYVVSGEISDIIVQVRSKAGILSISPRFSSAEYVEKYVNYETAVRRASNDLTLSIITKTSIEKSIGRQLAQLLNKNGVAVVKGNKADGIVSIVASADYSEDGGANNVNVLARMKISDDAGQVIANKQYRSSGRSYDGRDAAVNSAIKNLNYQLKINGIISGLGLGKL